MKKFAITNIEWDTLTYDGKHDPSIVPPVDHCKIEVYGHDSATEDEMIEILSDAIVTDFHHMHMGFTETLIDSDPDDGKILVNVTQ